ncbi:2-hydroxy-3-oxopropionate reductase [Kocuria dechangensis]|uniref:2-hydroxy-3-oxopropionate reductase n=1 Tax=Kocuria dechangensis TaxID=1176249 RepID=A0A917LND8_9MICC|nr:NAD(P)-dependent oxidoreductase [Kocuria dechangensis]GGG47472.1 2-hydroxy-3-oxopropionate reductase [Kocuria dechangensis]
MSEPHLTIGMIGLGNMGLPMSARLLQAGHRVLGFDLSPENLSAFSARGGTPAESVGGVTEDIDLLILMLPSSDIVENVLLEQGVAARMPEGAVVVDMSSSVPGRTKDLAERLRTGFGVRLVDAPVSGGVKGAVAGTLTIMVGGVDEDVAVVRPALEAMGRLVRTGPVASGHALKALNNLLSATHLLVTSEALHVGTRFGMDPEVMLEAINGASGRSGSTENKWPNFVVPQTYDSGFSLALMVKDMKIARELAHDVGLGTPLADRAVELWEQAAGELPQDADHTEIARWSALRQ